MTELSAIKHFILDMDGVLYRGDRALPGAREFLTFLQEENVPFLLLTNNSTMTPAGQVARLARLGIQVPESAILTSAQATAFYLRKVAPPGAAVYVVGEEGLRQAMLDQEFRVVEDGADFVVAGMDRKLTYEKLKRATLAIRAGARFIASNPDRTFPTEEGLVPGAGSILAALEASTDTKPKVIGKPQPAIFELALERMGVGKEGTAVVGDRLETDILGARRAGLKGILLLSGVSSRQDLEKSALIPDFVFADIGQLLKAWQEAR